LSITQLGPQESLESSRQLSGTDDASFFLDHDTSDSHWLALSGDEVEGEGSPKSTLSTPPCSPPRPSHSSSSASGGGGNGTASLDFALSRRYLRDKLSSPERKKPTPAEAKRRLDEKHFMADMKRAFLELERQNKLRLAAERIRDVNERRIRKTALAEKIYEAKLGQVRGYVGGWVAL
jgi:hypothetical protein